MSTLTAEQVRWDLSTLYSGIDDPRIASDWATLLAKADRFASTYRGAIDNPDLNAETLANALTELEAISNDVAKPYCFAEMMFASDTSNPAHGSFVQEQSELGTQLSVKLLFFELELQKAPGDVVDALLQDPRLAKYEHYVRHVRVLSPYRLSEAEEIILEEAANTGVRAWVRLFEEVTSNHVYHYTDPATGKVEEMSQVEVLDLLHSADRAERIAAGNAFTEGLKQQERVLVYTYNVLLNDKSIGDRLRRHPYAEHSRHLSNELDKETVDLVVRVCRENYGIVERFYHVKRRILGLDELTHVDRYAPLFDTTEEIPYEEGKEQVLSAFGNFSPVLRERAAEFFDKSWIDAAPRKGKMGGAFCMYVTPDTHPFVMMSYQNKADDVMTLAHELGHGVHASLSRQQSYMNFHGTLPLAELASTFGEMLVFDDLYAKANLKDRLAMVADKCESVFATIFRQAAMFQFEQECHERRRNEGELTAEEFGEIWQTKLQEMFGDSIKLGEQHKHWWSYISHFISVPFYVYAYSFGELLALALYEMSKTGGEEFERNYIAMLEMGGSKTPQELMATLGVDLKSEAFWRNGMNSVTALVEKFEMLCSEFEAESPKTT